MRIADRNERAYEAMPQLFLALHELMQNQSARSFLETRLPETASKLLSALQRVENDVPIFRHLDRVRKLAEIHTAWRG